MRVLPPLTITGTMITATNVAEPGPGETDWTSGGTYSGGEIRIRTSTHRQYKRLTAGAGSATPPESDGTNWQDIGPTNKWAMYDLLRSTGTTVASPLTVTLTPGQRIDAIGLVGLVADQVTITVKVSGVTKWTQTVNLLNRLTTGWYSFYYGRFRYKEEVAYFGLPPYSGATIEVSITRATGSVTCGGLVIGQSVYLGATQHGAEAEGLNFSKVDRDSFGTATLVPRRTVPRTGQAIRCAKSNVPRVRALIEDLNAVVALWSGLDDQDSGYFAPLLILGFYKKLSINMDHPEDALITLELEEV